MKMALTRQVSPSLARCELTHLPREPIDVGLARQQHGEYEDRLTQLGWALLRLPAEPELPDSVFVEDAAVVVDEVAVLARSGAPTRRGEAASIAGALAPYREIVSILPPGTLDGGDVLRIGKKIFVGISSRTNSPAIAQLRDLLGPRGYEVVAVPVEACLHLKSAVTQVSPDSVLLHPGWVPADPFSSFDRIEVDPSEPLAANGLLLDGTLVYPAAFPRTRERLEKRGIIVLEVDVSELTKAEGAVTCCSILFESRGAAPVK